MVEFRFDIKPLFPEPIVKVSSNLLPHTFRGDRRQCLDATSKMSEIIDRLGQLSATAQKLTKPVTTAQRLRMSENQIIYLMADVDEGHNGAVIGLLKVGTKDLYLFDEVGQTRKVDQTPCILDFYIHESRQRAGLGKQLFETMLLDQQWLPLKCSVDRPSEKLLGFLKKHYGLAKIIPQANNFVLYEGFFDDANDGDGISHRQQTNGGSGLHITNSPNTQLFGAHYLGDDANKNRAGRQPDAAAALAAQITQISPMGRYGARRPTCSMAESRKNPLDALSRMSLRQESFEKRSGLQDVDEEYLKKNVFARPAFPKHSGLNEEYANKNAMSQQQIQQHYQQNAAGISGQHHQHQQQQQQPPPLSQTESTYKLQTGADSASITPSQAQMQQQQQQHQQQAQGQAAAQSQQHQHQHGKNPSYKESSHIIHNNAATNKGTAESSSNADIETLTVDLQNLQTLSGEKIDLETQLTFTEAEISDLPSEAAEMQRHGHGLLSSTPDDIIVNVNEEVKLDITMNDGRSKTPSIIGSETLTIKKPTSFKLSKQHTGMKNISFGVGLAVTPSGKMEFDQESREDFGIVKINRPVGKLISPPPPDNTDAMSTVSSNEGLTDQGYHDLKFFHNKLW